MAVRRATLEDADAIGSVHVASWRAAYRGLMPDEFLDALSVEERAESWRRGFVQAAATPPDRSAVLVTVVDGEAVGFAALGPARRHPAVALPGGEIRVLGEIGAIGEIGAFGEIGAIGEIGAFGEIVAIYLLPAQWGRGLGRELMDASLAELRGWGFTSALLWVLEGNVRARRFYESGGWQTDGAVVVAETWLPFPLREVRYVLRL
jgi:GNAT superfamily N-acetyltransferase